jgi:hypothetical protein
MPSVARLPAHLHPGHRVEAGAEPQLHLLAVDRIPRGQAHAGQPPAVPVPGGLALDAVVVGERGVAAGGRIHSSNLAGQVLIARTRRQLLKPDRRSYSSHGP